MCNPLLNSFEIARDAMGTSTSKDTTLLAVAGAAVAAAGVSGYYFGKVK